MILSIFCFLRKSMEVGHILIWFILIYFEDGTFWSVGFLWRRVTLVAGGRKNSPCDECIIQGGKPPRLGLKGRIYARNAKFVFGLLDSVRTKRIGRHCFHNYGAIHVTNWCSTALLSPSAEKILIFVFFRQLLLCFIHSCLLHFQYISDLYN